MEVGTIRFTWKLKNFSDIQLDRLDSDVFSLGPYKWQISAYPKGAYPKGCFAKDYLSIFLMVADPSTLLSGWSRNAKFTFSLINQIDKQSSLTEDFEYVFKEKALYEGLFAFISHKELYDLSKGYLVDDTCIIEADVTIYDNASVDSNGPSKSEVNEEDMDAFFVDLNSVIFPEKVVSSEEEAKQALATIEEAFNMVPTDLNSSGRMCQLKNAFDVLSLMDDCSILTSEQKAELVSMKDDFIALSERASQAVSDKKLFTEKVLVKKTLGHKLGRCLVEFEKAKAEKMQYKQDISILQEQISEKKRKEEDSTSKQKRMFKQSKELKAELDVLVKQFPVYEARMNVAEEEEKAVGMKWSKMKQLFSSLKKPVN